MSTYVFSDVHGHRATLERVLERVSPGADDVVFCLGDMIDRGPDPIGVMRVTRSLPNVHVLKGNHEDLMLDALDHKDDVVSQANWAINGGMATLSGLEGASDDEASELIGWVRNLPLSAHIEVAGRPYIMAHAGIRPGGPLPADGAWNDCALDALIGEQTPDDLLWIRDEFWSVPTGLLNERGEGPIVVAGHTPTPYLTSMTDEFDRPVRNGDGIAQMVRVGACDATGGVADRWDIDSGAAGGAGFGQITMVRLDDGEECAEPVRDGE